MIIFQHIKELKWRFFYIGFCFLITWLISYLYSLELIFLFVRPILDSQNKLICTDIAEGLSMSLKIGFLTSFCVSMPFVWYQVWCFLIPSFYCSERETITRYGVALPIIWFFSYLLFFIGFPFFCELLLSYGAPLKILSIEFTVKLADFIRLATTVLIITLIVSITPLFFIGAMEANMIDPSTLSRNRNWFCCLWLIIAAFISPPDVTSQLTLSLIWNGVFELTIWLGFYLPIKR